MLPININKRKEYLKQIESRRCICGRFKGIDHICGSINDLSYEKKIIKNLKIAQKLKGKHNSINTEFKKGHKVPSSWKKIISQIQKGRRPSIDTLKERSKSLKETWIRNYNTRIKTIKRGNEHHNWKGTTPCNTQIRKMAKYNKWRMNIFKRDNYICQYCNLRSGNGNAFYLEAHHIKRFSEILQENNINSMEKALKCKELWDLNNGKTLCNECHKLIKGGVK